MWDKCCFIWNKLHMTDDITKCSKLSEDLSFPFAMLKSGMTLQNFKRPVACLFGTQQALMKQQFFWADM